MSLRVLFIGGTGIISSACTDLALQRGLDVTLLNRGRRGNTPEGATLLEADINDESAVAGALGDRQFDVVVNFIAFTPAHVERDLRLFAGRCRQYIFISSASAYQKPPSHPVITESTPLANPHWQYSRDKIACEERLLQAYREDRFPAMIVRPSLTYGDTLIPLAVNSWAKSWTVPQRMLDGLPVIVPGDGTSLWTTTHNSDFARGFVGLLGNPQTIGHAFHITSDESLTWDQHYLAVAAALGLNPATVKLVHIPSDLLAAWDTAMEGGLIGDKAQSVLFDNTKLRRFVPDFAATTPFALGIRRTIETFQADPQRQAIDDDFNAWCDRVLAAYASAWPDGRSPY